MTILSACQSAGLRVTGVRPAAIFSSSQQFEMELADLANEAAVTIAKAHDWQALTKLATITGTGTDTSFPLPSDYDRMPVSGDIHSQAWSLFRFHPARDLDQWLDYQTFIGAGVPGFWIIQGNRLQIQPAMGASEQARFYYISNAIALSATSDPKTAFTADTDTFALPERLVTLAIVWMWRAQKRLEYAEDMRNYEIALAQEILRDKGTRAMAVGRRGIALDTRVPYPGALG